MSRSKESLSAIRAVWMEGYREGYRQGLAQPRPPVVTIEPDDLRAVYEHQCDSRECPCRRAAQKIGEKE